MATLAKLGVKVKTVAILFTEFEESTIANRDGEYYFVGSLVNPISVRCSVDSTLEPVEVDELYMSPEIYNSDLWEQDDDGNYFIPGFKADFSKSHAVGLYQKETIQQWVRGQRQEQKKKADKSLKDRIAELKAKKLGVKTDEKPEVTTETKNSGKANKPAKVK